MSGITTAEFAERMQAFSRAMREQEIRNIMALTGCRRQKAEEVHEWLVNGDGAALAVSKAGRTMGDRLAEGFRSLLVAAEQWKP